MLDWKTKKTVKFKNLEIKNALKSDALRNVTLKSVR
jgi:hypothetical protein